MSLAVALLAAGLTASQLVGGEQPADAGQHVPRAAPGEREQVRPGARTPAEPFEVGAVQHTLRGLGYQVREVSGVVDDETRHAVVAFQKVQGLPRTGVLDPDTLAALEDPAVPRPRSAGRGFHVEVDLTTQVAYTVVDGEVRRIYDASTGREPAKRTPVGEFTVRYQIDGMRYAPLGPLYRPSYITDTGIALHGGEPVEPWPASNGCVRLTDPSVDELFGKLRPGTTVVVYRS
ncbi:putative peptidoglycan binding protein [Prauserella shujinwangii]|uniref:Putative peptidoglycan binding protein n=2 Tax=Prauserella shujinwangii TaxID=1453103 RepID=A0A2T0LKC8_9PSEU|nr:putative peptidoglycan binding protein [Prauserella shujinwangii]